MNNIFDDNDAKPAPVPEKSHRDRYIEELEEKAKTSVTSRHLLDKIRNQSEQEARELDASFARMIAKDKQMREKKVTE